MTTIKELAETNGFRGSGNLRQAEPQPVTNLQPIDNGNPVDNRGNVATSIDCYVAGTYTTRKGQRMEVMQRYTIYVKYDANSQGATMAQVRNQISADFSRRYGQFMIGTIFVPDLQAAPVIPAPGQGDDAFYGGRDAWERRIMRAQFEIGTELEKERRNVSNIRRKYGLR